MNLSVIGTGNMGRAIACALLSAGHQVTVYNRTFEKAQPLASQGAHVAATAAEAISSSDYIIVALYDSRSARSVLLADEVRPVLRGKALMSTVAMEPEEIIALSNDVSREGGRLSDGSIASYPDAVENRQSESIIASFPEDAKAWQAIFGDLGPKVHDIGAIGNSSKVQMSLLLSHMFVRIAIAYSLAAFEKQNLPVDFLRSALSENLSQALPCADSIISEMAKRAYGSSSWTVDMTVLSIDQGIQFAQKLGIDTAAMVEIRDMYVKASRLGFGARDATALYEAVNPR
jgi:3-hydroxyisobutyrate dehydrogenase